MAEDNNLKRTTVKCHGKFSTTLKVSASKNQVKIEFIADQNTVDLNKLGGDLKGWCYSYFC